MADPLLQPIEHRLARAGRNPQDAPTLAARLHRAGRPAAHLACRLVRRGSCIRVQLAAGSGPRGAAAFLIQGVFALLIAALIIRVVASWFGIGAYDRRFRPIILLTEWLVAPIRRVVPPMGMIDVSPLVAYSSCSRCVACSSASCSMSPLEATGGGVRLRLRIQPRASRTEVAGLHGTCSASGSRRPPVDGAANEALIRFLADLLGVPTRAVEITGGPLGAPEVGSRQRSRQGQARRPRWGCPFPDPALAIRGLGGRIQASAQIDSW